MKAMQLAAPRSALRLVDLPAPRPGPGQLLIKVRACGVCRTDLHVVDGDLMQGKMPIIPGHEIIGTIVEYFKDKEDVRILVLPDHATPIEKRTHVSDPVGFVMFGKGISPDGSMVYSEAASKAKGLKFKSGEELMEFFIRHP